MIGAPAAIAIERLNHWYGAGALRKQVLFDIDLTVMPGEVVFLMGPSGCGKTTILTLAGALRSVQDGEIRVLGTVLSGASERVQVETRRRIGFVFQSHNLHRSLDAVQNVRMGLEAQGKRLSPEADARCLALLDIVGLADHAHKRQDQLSGGQRQRVAIARALVADPAILLGDEPTAALDGATGREIVSLIRGLAKSRGMAVLMVTHDSRILEFADRVVEMEDGRIRTSATRVAPILRVPKPLLEVAS
jgi:putative ABC transport system ATP-binding protein